MILQAVRLQMRVKLAKRGTTAQIRQLVTNVQKAHIMTKKIEQSQVIVKDVLPESTIPKVLKYLRLLAKRANVGIIAVLYLIDLHAQKESITINFHKYHQILVKCATVDSIMILQAVRL